MIYIDTDGNARKTGCGAAMDSNSETLAAFNSYRHLNVGNPVFLLDYYNAKGNLSDTIGIASGDFPRITGEAVKSDEHYKKVDADFWRDAREKRGAGK